MQTNPRDATPSGIKVSDSPLDTNRDAQRHAPDAGIRSGIRADPARRVPNVLPAITGRYLLTTFCLPFYVDSAGRRFMDPLWIKDLKEHCRYIQNLVLASPRRDGAPPDGYVAVDTIAELAGMTYVDLPAPRNTLDALRLLPQTLRRLWQATREAEIVHSSIAGWPIPEGWIMTPLAKINRRFTAIIVESSAWRVPAGVESNWKQRVRAWVTERINRLVLRHTDLPIFNQERYREEFLAKQRDRGHVIHASWIDEHNLLTPREAAEIWRAKRSAGEGALRLIYAAHLNAAKGLPVLLEAMRKAAELGLPIQLDVYGNGPLLDECASTAAKLKGETRIRLRGTVAYGPEFFRRLQRYHALVYPVVSEEQPRIIFDAYSQALPILASATHGMQANVRDFHTGRLYPPNDADAVCAAIQWALENRPRLEVMGMNGLRYAEGQTHEAMHRERWQLLAERLDPRLLTSGGMKPSIEMRGG